jgi:hypothetical protein
MTTVVPIHKGQYYKPEAVEGRLTFDIARTIAEYVSE